MLSEEQLRKFKDFSGKLCLAGRFEECIKSAQAALETLEADKDFPETGKRQWGAAFQTIIANAFLAGNDPRSAVEHFKKALEFQMSAPKSINIAFILDSLAKAQEFLGDINASLESRVASLEILEEFSPQSRLLIDEKYRAIAADYDSLGRVKEAEMIRARIASK